MLYLGTNVSADNLHYVIERKKPHVVLGYIANPSKALHRNLSSYLNAESGTSLLLTGADLDRPGLPGR